MSESRRKTSVAAFLFLPQLHLSFQGFSHIVPVFMRSLAMMFASANLVPQSHPALRYGVPGVPKYSLWQLIGEAWFTLRTTDASPQQWGVFGAIILMMSMLVLALGSFIANVFFNLGNTAIAQIFSHPVSPYAKGPAGGTGMENVKDTGSGSNLLFDTRFTTLEPSQPEAQKVATDYALMVLDKVLRQSAVGEGGALQTALAGLMGVYNTAVLVVASVIIFWMILSIVVDTAKTGVIGGGRHNMVWAPIRIVFALGIMIPLGATGFSSGQFMVMKLAEWGSNLGTRGWSTYVTGVLSNARLLSPFMPDEASTLAQAVVKLKVCQVAYNSYVYESATPNPRQIIVAEKKRTYFGLGDTVNTYSNKTSRNLCGSITYPSRDSTTTDDLGRLMEGLMGRPSSTIKPLYDLGDINKAASQFRKLMRNSMEPIFDEVDPTATGPQTAADQVFMDTARDFACSFVSSQFVNAGGGSTTRTGNSGGIIPDCAAADWAACGGDDLATPPVLPNTSCHQRMVDAIIDGVSRTYCGADDCTGDVVNAAGPATAVGQLRDYISGQMITNAEARGWGGMGRFYQDISTLSALASAAKDVTVTVTPGTLFNEPPEKPPGRRRAKTPAINFKVYEILEAYDNWWEVQMSDPAVVTEAGAAADKRSKDLSFSTKKKGGFLSFLAKAGTMGANYFIGGIFGMIMPMSSTTLIEVFDSADSREYPMTTLSNAGYKLILMGALMMATTSILQTVSTISALGNTIGPGFAVSSLMSLLWTAGIALVVCGMMLAFYLPFLPMMRVAFAVLTWIISVFEAVCMVPIAALAHLSSEGEGLAGGAKTVWILWLNILLRPILVVLGFVGALLVYNAFIVYIHIAFTSTVAAMQNASSPIYSFFAMIAYTIFYIGIMYTAANTTFKMMDTIPNAMMRWLGGSPDTSFDNNDADALVLAGTNMLRNVQPGRGGEGKKDAPGDPAGAKNATPKGKP